MHAGKYLGQGHGAHAVRRREEHLSNADAYQRGAAAEQVHGVEGILEVAVVAPRQDVHRRVHHQKRQQEPPSALETDQVHHRQPDLLDHVLLADYLRRLHSLAGEDQAHAQESIRQVVAGVAQAVANDVREPHENHANEARRKPHPMEARHLLAKERDRQGGSEQNPRAPEHVEDAGRDVEQAEGAQRRRDEVAQGRHACEQRRPPAPRRLAGGPLRAVGVPGLAAEVGAPVAAQAAGHEAGGADNCHAEEEHDEHRPRPAELFGRAMPPNSPHAELDLRDQRARGPAQQHRRD
mmetsp:Transcript_52233/g.152084  ORF Transcript_52233/g.152084 Transcript_52233/m.152084 type:complete len:294 (+) Transcript_52233:324-1205(+)